MFEDSVRYGRKGSDFLLPALESHSPIDTVVLMLGTNDCKSIYKASATVIGKGIEILLRQIRSFDKSSPHTRDFSRELGGFSCKNVKHMV